MPNPWDAPPGFTFDPVTGQPVPIQQPGAQPAAPQPVAAPTPGGPTPVPGVSLSGVQGLTAAPDAFTAAFGGPPASSHMFRGGGYGGGRSSITAYMHPSTFGQQISDAAAIEGGNPAVAQPVSSGKNPAPSLPQPTITLPQFTAHAPPRTPQSAAPPGAPPYGSPWDPQGVGYARSWDPQGAGYAAAQRLGQPQGVLASGQQPNSPFTMVLRPNAPANSGGRGGGGTPLGTALDLSGYQPQPWAPPAPPSINLGYGGGGGGGGAPAPRGPAPRAQAPQGYNPFTHVWRDAPANRVPIGHSVSPWGTGSGIVQGPHGTELMNPGKPLFGW